MACIFFEIMLPALLVENQDCAELVRPDLLEADSHAQLQRRPKVYRSPYKQSRFRGLSGIQFVQRAMVAPPAFIRGIGAEAGIAQFLAAEGPMDQKPQGGLLRPLPGC